MKKMSLLITFFALFLLTLSAVSAQEVHYCFLFLDFPEDNLSSGTLNKWDDGVVTPIMDDVFDYARANNTEMYYARKLLEGYQILDGNQTVLFESLNSFGGMTATSGMVIWSDVFLDEGIQTSFLFKYQVDTNRVEYIPDYDGAIMPQLTDSELLFVEDNYLVFPEGFLISSMYSPTGFSSYSVDPLNAFVVYTRERELFARQHNEMEAILITPKSFYVDEVAWHNAYALIFSGEADSGEQGIWLIHLPNGENRFEREVEAVYQSPEGRIAASPSYCQSAIAND